MSESEADAFYEKHLAPLETRMLRTAWRITRDPDRARDALQDAMARIWSHRERVRAHPNPPALVLRVVIHSAIDALRRERSMHTAQVAGGEPREAPASPEASPSLEAERREVRALVLAAVARLPEKQAAAVTLRLLDDEPYDAIAAALGCAEPTARVHVLRGRARLASLLRALAPTAGSSGGGR